MADLPSDLEHTENTIQLIYQHDISQLTAVIQTAQSELAERRKQSTSSLSVARSISPINALPREIMLTIFLEYIAANQEYIATARLRVGGNFSTGPKIMLRLSHVCCAWRDLAFSTWEFWANPFFYVNRGYGQKSSENDEKVSRQIETAKQWVDRGRPSGRLSLFLRDSRWADGRRLRVVYLDKVLGYNWRGIQKINLGLPYHHYRDLIPRDDTNDWNITGIDGRSLPPDPPTVAPDLTDVTLHSTPEAEQPTGYPFIEVLGTNIPWLQLTHLRIPTLVIDLRDLHAILKQTTFLVHGSFCTQYWETENDAPTDATHFTPVTVPNLHTFIVRIQGYYDEDHSLGTRWLFNSLTLPALRTFILKYSRISILPMVNLDLGSILTSFQQRSKFPLENFHLSGEGVLVDDLLPFLNAVPCVHSLTLDGWECEPLLVALIAPTLSLPNLTHFTYWTDEGTTPWHVLLPLIQSRWWKDQDDGAESTKDRVRLKDVSFAHQDCRSSSNVAKELNAWEAEGLGVCLLDMWDSLEWDESQQ